MTLVLGVAYPLAVWGVGQVAFRAQANGSMVQYNGQPVGSSLIGQNFDGPEWFHPRPSAAGDGYDAMSSGASNLAPTSQKLLGLVESRRVQAAEENGIEPDLIPPEALTASGSGLDPHISPEYAALQAERVARARGLDTDQVRTLVDQNTQGRVLGFLGEPRVNVLELNLALENLQN
jgi:K+-transporting ATPase ATPase C chain